MIVMRRWLAAVVLPVVMTSCGNPDATLTADQATIEYALLYDLPATPVSYETRVRPVLEKRCVVCHGCYDAPCQLKLSSTEGIERGANPEKVYNGVRITADPPTRLFIDAFGAAQWRQKGFHPVLNEPPGNPRSNLENSVMYKMLRLKQRHPQARVGMLSERFDLGLDRKQSCPTVETMDDYIEAHPEGGMPYAMPNLASDDYNTLVHWIAQGAPMPEPALPSAAVLPQIERWERFLNGESLREKLVSRYLYEHLFQAHIHFDGTPDREFYRLIRSCSPPGETPRPIATRRPYGHPGAPVYYRIARMQGSVVAKNHLVYPFSDRRMQRYRELFFEPEYTVDRLPGYQPELASNPIKTFRAIPLKSRYRFLLDDAKFFIEGFIKGPVCRGQVALNVIEDQFWVFFFDPDADIPLLDEALLNATADDLATPSELEDTFDLLASRVHYRELFQRYVAAKQARVKHFPVLDLGDAMRLIWDGDGHNPNAALTVFRHYDSASVNQGLIGDYPETAWVLDYSVLERIHYLLVSGFDVYGNLGHQLNTRLYMDFLRTEGEDHFLAFLPGKQRRAIRDRWYQGIRESDREDTGRDDWLSQDFVTGYVSSRPQQELYQHLEKRLAAVAGQDWLNRCQRGCLADMNITRTTRRVYAAMQRLSSMSGAVMKLLPDLAFVRVRMSADDAGEDMAFSLISNKAYKSVRWMFEDENLLARRDYLDDTQTVVPWLEGVYPNFFYDVKADDIDAFVDSYQSIHSREDYEKFVARFGMRRTNPQFWALADWFADRYRREAPLQSGILDLNRYQNR